MMLTFTIDPELFESPQAAFDYVSKNRCISVTMQNLRRFGVLEPGRCGWFCVVEWQKDSEMPHWHVLIDADFIDFEKLKEAWNRNWKDWKERVAAGRPGFGSVRFTRRKKFVSSTHAALYATKYLIKFPAHGFPAWVMDQPRRRVHRYSVSRGFWPEEEEADHATEEPETDDEQVEEVEEAESKEEKDSPTLRELVANCGQGKSCKAFQIIEKIDEASGEIRRSLRFLGNVIGSLSDLAAAIGVEAQGDRLPCGSLEQFEASFDRCGHFTFIAHRNRVENPEIDSYPEAQRLNNGHHADGRGTKAFAVDSAESRTSDRRRVPADRAEGSPRVRGRRERARSGDWCSLPRPLVGVEGTPDPALERDLREVREGSQRSIQRDSSRDNAPFPHAPGLSDHGDGQQLLGGNRERQGRSAEGERTDCNGTSCDLKEQCLNNVTTEANLLAEADYDNPMVHLTGSSKAPSGVAADTAQLDKARQGASFKGRADPSLSGSGLGSVHGTVSCFMH
jgi:hypothetical protein